MRRDRNSHRVSVFFFDGLRRTVLRRDGGGRVRWAYRSAGMDVADLKATFRAGAVGWPTSMPKEHAYEGASEGDRPCYRDRKSNVSRLVSKTIRPKLAKPLRAEVAPEIGEREEVGFVSAGRLRGVALVVRSINNERLACRPHRCRDSHCQRCRNCPAACLLKSQWKLMPFK